MNASRSCFVIRPPAPVPRTWFKSISFHAPSCEPAVKAVQPLPLEQMRGPLLQAEAVLPQRVAEAGVPVQPVPKVEEPPEVPLLVEEPVLRWVPMRRC